MSVSKVTGKIMELDWGSITPDFYNEKLKQAVSVYNVAFEKESERSEVFGYILYKAIWHAKHLHLDTQQAIEIDLRGQRISFTVQDIWRSELLKEIERSNINATISFLVD